MDMKSKKPEKNHHIRYYYHKGLWSISVNETQFPNICLQCKYFIIPLFWYIAFSKEKKYWIDFEKFYHKIKMKFKKLS